jgi:monoamine oxidase
MENVLRAAAEVAAEDGDRAWRTTRAGLLRRAGVAGLGVAGLTRLTSTARAASSASVVVVGAGLAGLTCAYRLKQAGYRAHVHEAATRLGGRCWSGRGFFADGQVYEHGGELIDQGHNQLRSLVQELGLALDNLQQGEVNGTEVLAYFDGAPYTFAAMTDDLKKI